MIGRSLIAPTGDRSGVGGGIRVGFGVGASTSVLALAALAGCAATPESGDTGTRDRAASPPATGQPAPASLADEVERRYVIGPAAARSIGYRIDWQHTSAGRRIKRVDVQGDSVFTLDEGNVLTRLRRDEGTQYWRLPVARPIEAILGITFVPDLDRVFLAMGSDLLVIDAASGARIGKQRLSTPLNTATVPVERFLIYGSRNGQIVWHSYVLDSTWQAYQVAQSIAVPPVYSDGYIVAVGTDGRVMSLDASSASQIWRRKALAPIVAAPVAGNGAVYVASLDHHLRAFELNRQRTPLWEYLTESPLDNSPVLVGDRVYQHVDSEGLVCLEALPLDSPGGVVVWRTAEARGNVLTRLRGSLLTWDGAGKRLEVVDARLGAVIDTLELPHVDTLMATDVEAGTVYATSLDGRVIRLVPR